MDPYVVLASASPRRSELLRAAGVAFEVDRPDVDETVAPGTPPEAAAEMLAERKARAVAARRGLRDGAGREAHGSDVPDRDVQGREVLGRGLPAPSGSGPSVPGRAPLVRDVPTRDIVVLAADTIVAVDVAGVPMLLGKPADDREAAEMLRALSGTRHRVVTGVAALHARTGGLCVGHERTWVTMRVITPSEVAAYVASGEWRDKAGGYAIQENADRFVTRLEEGGFDNVVGLPVRLALDLVRRAATGLAPGGRPG